MAPRAVLPLLAALLLPACDSLFYVDWRAEVANWKAEGWRQVEILGTPCDEVTLHLHMSSASGVLTAEWVEGGIQNYMKFPTDGYEVLLNTFQCRNHDSFVVVMEKAK